MAAVSPYLYPTIPASPPKEVDRTPTEAELQRVTANAHASFQSVTEWAYNRVHFARMVFHTQEIEDKTVIDELDRVLIYMQAVDGMPPQLDKQRFFAVKPATYSKFFGEDGVDKFGGHVEHYSSRTAFARFALRHATELDEAGSEQVVRPIEEYFLATARAVETYTGERFPSEAYCSALTELFVKYHGRFSVQLEGGRSVDEFAPGFQLLPRIKDLLEQLDERSLHSHVAKELTRAGRGEGSLLDQKNVARDAIVRVGTLLKARGVKPSDAAYDRFVDSLRERAQFFKKELDVEELRGRLQAAQFTSEDQNEWSYPLFGRAVPIVRLDQGEGDERFFRVTIAIGAVYAEWEKLYREEPTGS